MMFGLRKGLKAELDKFVEAEFTYRTMERNAQDQAAQRTREAAALPAPASLARPAAGNANGAPSFLQRLFNGGKSTRVAAHTS
jgi:hypothetical protein